MVAEISPGIYECERFSCNETFTAERPGNKRSRAKAQRQARSHEATDTLHIGILDLSTLPPNPDKPNAIREGFVATLSTINGLEILSRKIHPDRMDAEVEGSVVLDVFSEGLLRERRGRHKVTAYQKT